MSTKAIPHSARHGLARRDEPACDYRLVQASGRKGPGGVTGGFVLLTARRPRCLGRWGLAIGFGLPLWYVAVLSTGCNTG